LHKDTVLHNGSDMANVRWKYDDYFRRDGRNIGSCNWFTIGSNWCIDLWHPLEDITYEQALDNILPIPNELNHNITKEHLIDDYTLSRNIARYGLKFITAIDLLPTIKLTNTGFFWHEYTIPTFVKIRKMKMVIYGWQVNGLPTLYHHPSPFIQGWCMDDELQWLFANAAEMESVVEIGSWKGRSTHAIATGCKGKVYAVDHFKGSPEEIETTHIEAQNNDIQAQFLHNMSYCPNVELWNMSSLEAAARFEPKSVDMVYIDGDHSNQAFEADLKAWTPIAKKLICGHDFPLVESVLIKLNKTYHRETEDIWTMEI